MKKFQLETKNADFSQVCDCVCRYVSIANPRERERERERKRERIVFGIPCAFYLQHHPTLSLSATGRWQMLIFIY